ncbi:murein biosynthesis integral membrane protein MurJ [Bacillus sp. DJP31]|uniref:murein biosynthesis integral membrane protein MurJ n=1 Tax=Bacillus sp. DJP31 TaxID=3409789 RepID=UPI003BB51A2F
MKKTVVVLIIIGILSKLSGFMRDISLSFFYGASNISDVYIISLTIPTIIIAIVGKGIYTGFVPMYTRVELLESQERAEHYTNNLANFVLIICGGIFIIGIFFTEPIVKLFASGFSGQTLELAIVFTRISLLGLFFSGLIYVYTAYLQVKNFFIIPALMGIPANFIVIGSFIVSKQTNIYALAIGSVVATLSQFLLLLAFSYKKKYRFQFRFDVNDIHIKKMMILAFPVIIGSSVTQINLLIDRTLASYIAAGGVSALNYATTINLVVLGVIVNSITSVLYPKISKMASENNLQGIHKYLSHAVNFIPIFILPATVIYLLFPEEIILLLYGRGEFNAQAVAMTSSALFFYSIGIIGMSYRELFSNVFYSLQDTKTPTINATLSMVLNIILNFVLFRYLGVGGIALATSISVLFCSFLLWNQLRKRIGSFDMKSNILSLSKTCIATIAMGGVSFFSYALLQNHLSSIMALVLSIFFGLIVYIGLILILNIKEVQTIVLRYRRKSGSGDKVKQVV